MSNIPQTIEECLANTVRRKSCLIWLGAKASRMGYARFSCKVGTGSRSGHREIYMHFHGAIPKNYDVGHLCDTPLCINPKHLKVQTRKQNLQQAAQRGRTAHNFPVLFNGPGTQVFSDAVSAGCKRRYASLTFAERKLSMKHKTKIKKAQQQYWAVVSTIERKQRGVKVKTALDTFSKAKRRRINAAIAEGQRRRWAKYREQQL